VTRGIEHEDTRRTDRGFLHEYVQKLRGEREYGINGECVKYINKSKQK